MEHMGLGGKYQVNKKKTPRIKGEVRGIQKNTGIFHENHEYTWTC